ncbi:MAG: MXAN_5187 C-terminal domain-containing protein [Myxococcota bacterium]
MSDLTQSTGEIIETLERKLGMLKREYEQYFLGTRPREPILLKGEVQKTVAFLSNTPIQNTALRFKFSSVCSRYQAFKRQWDETLRKIESGTYERHQFKARLHGSAAPTGAAAARPAAPASQGDLYQDYVDARLACGQSAKGITRDKLEQQLAKQRTQLEKKFGADARFQFRVAVEDGKVRLKAKRLKGAEA